MKLHYRINTLVCYSHQATHSNGSEEVDGKPSVTWVVSWHKPFKCWSQKPTHKQTQEKCHVNMDPFLHRIYTIGLYTV